MIAYYLSLVDQCLFWQLLGRDDEGREIFAEPILINCRWDTVQESTESDDVVTTQSKTNSVFPDRVLVVGSYVMLGNQETLDNLTPEEIKHPKLLRNARAIQSQSTIAELGWEQKEYPPGYMSEPLVVECKT